MLLADCRQNSEAGRHQITQFFDIAALLCPHFHNENFVQRRQIRSDDFGVWVYPKIRIIPNNWVICCIFVKVFITAKIVPEAVTYSKIRNISMLEKK